MLRDSEDKICSWLTRIAMRPVTSFRSLSSLQVYSTLVASLPYFKQVPFSCESQTVGDKVVYMRKLSESIKEYVANVLCMSYTKAEVLMRNINYTALISGDRDQILCFLAVIILLYIWSPLKTFLARQLQTLQDKSVKEAVDQLIEQALALGNQIEPSYVYTDQMYISRIRQLERQKTAQEMRVDFLEQEISQLTLWLQQKQDQCQTAIHQKQQLSLELNNLRTSIKKRNTHQLSQSVDYSARGNQSLQESPSLSKYLQWSLDKARYTAYKLGVENEDLKEKNKRMSSQINSLSRKVLMQKHKIAELNQNTEVSMKHIQVSMSKILQRVSFQQESKENVDAGNTSFHKKRLNTQTVNQSGIKEKVWHLQN